MHVHVVWVHTRQDIPFNSLFRLSPSASSDTEQVYPFPDADPYLTEVECFLDAVRSGDPTRVKSSYRDASMTYNLSWAIRRASEKTAQIA